MSVAPSRASVYRDFGTPRMGEDRAAAPERLRLRRPAFGASRSRRNATQPATPIIVNATAKKLPNAQSINSITMSSGGIHV